MSDKVGQFQRRSPVERLAIVEEKVQAAHKRMDNFQDDVKRQLDDIGGDIKVLLGHYHQSVGRTAAIIAIATLLGGVVGWFAEHYLK